MPPTVVCAVAPDTPECVVDAARWLAEELGGEVVLAHAFDAMDIALPTSREVVAAHTTSDELAHHVRQGIEERLRQLGDRLTGIDHKTVVIDGPPVPVLLKLVAEHQCALLLTGTATRSSLDRILVGSVASELAAKAASAVMIVPNDATFGASGPVVVGYDGSDHSLSAARHAAALAALLERQLVLVHVVEGDEEPVQADKELAQDLYDAISAVVDDRLKLVASVAIERGRPAERLAEVAEERDAAFLVSGTRGRGAVTSALLGSVSASIVQAGGRPVVLVGPAVTDP